MPLEIDKERGVVVEEWRLGQGAGERMRKQYFPILFKDSRYADRLPIGQREILQTFPRDQLVRFYRDWYRPDLMAVIAVGDFDKATVEKMIRDRFGSIPAATAPKPRREFGVPDHAETLVAIATDKEATSTVVEVNWKLPAQPQGTRAAYRASLVRMFYDAMLNARLGEITQKPNSPFIGAGSNYGSLVRAKDMYSMGAAVQDGGVAAGLEAVLTEGERVARHGFTTTEFERQKTDLLRGYEAAYAERDKSESSGYADEYVRAFLEGEGIPGIAAEYELVKLLTPGITLAEVNALGRSWMTAGNRVVVVTAPETGRASIPAPAELRAAFDRVKARNITPFVDVVATTALIENPPTPGRIVSSRAIPRVDATLLTLSNGAKVYLKPTKLKDDQVLVGAYSPGGLSLIPDAEYASGLFSSTLIGISGLGSMDAIQLEKALTGKVAQVFAAPAEFSEQLGGAASPRDLETLFQRLYLNFTAPRSDSAAYESYLARFRAAMANRSADPNAAFSDTFSVTLWQNHPRARPQTMEFINSIDRATAFRIFRDRISDADDFTFAFVGSFDPEAIKPLIEKYIASLPSTPRADKPKDTGMRPVRGVVEKTVKRGVEPKSNTRITFTGPIEYTAPNRLAMAMLIDVLDMKLRDVLREDLGGTYGVSISQSVQRFPEPRYSISVAFGSAPERMDELVKAIFAEMEKIKANGPDADALAKVKEQARRSYETGLQQNEFWMSLLLREAETGETSDTALDYVARANAVTAEQIRDAARKWIDLGNYVRVTLVPER